MLGTGKVIHIAGNLPPLITVVLHSDRIWIKELKKGHISGTRPRLGLSARSEKYNCRERQRN